MDAINALHQRDMEASKKWDVDTLASLWADDIVTLTQGEPPMIGKDANRAAMMRLREESSGVQITDYIMSFNEVKIVDDWAFEWGTYSGTVKPLTGASQSERPAKLSGSSRRTPMVRGRSLARCTTAMIRWGEARRSNPWRFLGGTELRNNTVTSPGFF